MLIFVVCRSDSRWRTNEVNFSAAEISSRLPLRSRQHGHAQYGRANRRSRVEVGMGGRTDRTNVMRRGRVFRVSVRRLHNAHGADQRHGEHTNHPHESAPL
jgi:hypothetical protein